MLIKLHKRENMQYSFSLPENLDIELSSAFIEISPDKINNSTAAAAFLKIVLP